MREVEIIRHPQIDGLHVFLDTVDYRTPHVHRELELLWVFDGRLTVRSGALQREAGPDDIMLIGPNQTHEFYSGKTSCTFLCLQIAPDLLRNARPALETVRWEEAFPKPRMTGKEYADLKQRLLSLACEYLERPPYYELDCVGQAHLLLCGLLKALPHQVLSPEELAERDRRSERLRRLIDFVDKNYRNRIRLTDFAESEGLSMSYLSHFVKQMLNQSFQEYVNTVRFNAACKLMASGQTKMLDVCLDAGFSDYRYFSQTFQKRVGLTPEAYSRQVRVAVPEEAKIHRSLHSLERFYSREKSLELLRSFTS